MWQGAALRISTSIISIDISTIYTIYTNIYILEVVCYTNSTNTNTTVLSALILALESVAVVVGSSSILILRSILILKIL